jgi:hypothetical protein
LREVVGSTGIDGFMIDWLWAPNSKIRARNGGVWIDAEKALYTQLMNVPFPAEGPTAEEELVFSRKSIERCWRTIHKATKETNPDCLIWLSCSSITAPVIADSVVLGEVDWLMSEAPDPAEVKRLQAKFGDKPLLMQNLCGGHAHDAKKLLYDLQGVKIGYYGFARPGVNGYPPELMEDGQFDQKNWKPNYARQSQYLQNAKNLKSIASFYRGELELERPAFHEPATIKLNAEEGTVHGSALIYEPHFKCFGHWNNPAEWVEWKFFAPLQGSYLLKAESASVDDTTVQIRCGSQQFTVFLPKTGSYVGFEPSILGMIDVESPEDMKLELRAVNADWKPVNVRHLVLERMETQATIVLPAAQAVRTGEGLVLNEGVVEGWSVEKSALYWRFESGFDADQKMELRLTLQSGGTSAFELDVNGKIMRFEIPASWMVEGFAVVPVKDIKGLKAGKNRLAIRPVDGDVGGLKLKSVELLPSK